MRDSVKHFAQFQAEDFSCSSLTHHHCNSIVEGQEICHVWFSCSEAPVAVKNHILTFHVPYQSFQEDLLPDVDGHWGETDQPIGTRLAFFRFENRGYVFPFLVSGNFKRLPWLFKYDE